MDIKEPPPGLPHLPPIRRMHTVEGFLTSPGILYLPPAKSLASQSGSTVDGRPAGSAHARSSSEQLARRPSEQFYKRYLLYAPDLHSNLTHVYKTKSLSDLIPSNPERVLPALVQCRCSPVRCLPEGHRCRTPKTSAGHVRLYRQMVVPEAYKTRVYREVSSMAHFVVSILEAINTPTFTYYML